jgi:hypothetical protein
MSAEKTKMSQQEVVPPHVEPSESSKVVRVMSSEDTLVADLVAEQPTLEQVGQMKVKQRSIPNLLEIPEECVPLQRTKYRYVWLTKGKDLSVKLRTNGWVLCNRSNSPHIKEYRFGSHGAIEQGGMLLAFLPEAVAMELEMGPARMSQERVKHYTKGIFEQQDKDAPAQFYKPDPDDKD